MSTPHPKALEAQEKAQQRAKRRASLKDIVQSCIKEGVHFIEVVPANYDVFDSPKPPKRGRMTIAFAPYQNNSRNIFAVSTAICHPDDEFDKLEGRARAGVNMAKGHHILLRKPTGTPLTTKQWLLHKFTEHSE